MKIVVTAYLINMQMPLTMILTNRKTFAIQITKQTGDNQATNHYASEDNGGRG
jgi:hypothetical protein